MTVMIQEPQRGRVTPGSLGYGQMGMLLGEGVTPVGSLKEGGAVYHQANTMSFTPTISISGHLDDLGQRVSSRSQEGGGLHAAYALESADAKRHLTS